MKREKFTVLVSVLLIFLLGIFLTLSGGADKRRAEKLASYGEAQFIEEDFPGYLGKIQAQGLSDLTAEVHLGYSYEFDYDKDTKTLHLQCRLKNFSSEEIDKYFTTGYNGWKEQKLADLLKAIRSAYTDETYTYVMDSVGTVVVRVDKPDHEICISTPSGREYRLVYGYIESVRVEIDNDDVFSANEANTDEIVGEVPYIGMSKKHINHTELGFYDKVEYCKDYAALRFDHQSATYEWYDENGDKLFSAYVLGDEVISTIDIRSGKIISKGPNDR